MAQTQTIPPWTDEEYDNHCRFHTLPIGQPTGLSAFSDANSAGLLQYWRHFTWSDLYPGALNTGSGCRTLVTVDHQPDGWHICFMQEGVVKGLSVTNCIQNLASCIVREASMLAQWRCVRDGGRSPLSRLAQRWPFRGMRVSLPLGRFNFYQHSVANQYLREQFDRVVLSLERGEFHSPEWRRFDLLPAVIQRGQFVVRHSSR